MKVISPKQELIDKKAVYPTYSKWGDPTHWSQRGAYIGYLKLMEEINADSVTKYRILTEDDYNITLMDKGRTLFGGIHNEDLLENFEIKTPKAMLTNEKLTVYSEDERHKFFTNDADIVIVEAAERVDRTGGIINGANVMKEAE